MSFVLLCCKISLSRIRGEHLVLGNTCRWSLASQVKLDIAATCHLSVVVQITSGEISEGIVMGANALAAVGAEVVGLALALIVLAAETVSTCKIACKEQARTANTRERVQTYCMRSLQARKDA